jgi:hypothetical protein
LSSFSFFGSQEGDFELHLFSISAFKHVPFETQQADREEEEAEDDDDVKAGERGPVPEHRGKRNWWKGLLFCGMF